MSWDGKMLSWDGKMYGKYMIEHADGTPLKGKKYFVLRLDSDNPVEAARVAAAMRAYKGEPRNCDRFHTGDVKQDAQAAMEAILAEGVAGYRGIAEYLLSPAKSAAAATPDTPETQGASETPKGGAVCGDNRFEVIESAKKELLRCTNIGGSPDEMAVLDSLLFRMWQMRWLPGCERREKHDNAPASPSLELPRAATDEEVEAGDAQWCRVCRTECVLRGRDILVHGCAGHNPEKALS